MHFSKALQPGCTFHLGLGKVSVCLKCKGKTYESVSFFKKGVRGVRVLMLMQYHCSPLNGRQNKPGTDFRFYVTAFSKSILSRVRERGGGRGGVVVVLPSH